MKLNANEAQEMYLQMQLIRRFEEESSRLYMQGKIHGFLHLYIGQEAVAAGAIPILDSQDYIVSHYRDHGHALARGLDPRSIMAELMGKSTGCSGGRGGSMHLFDVAKGFWGGYAIVAGQLPIAAGLALSTKYKKEDRVTMCFFGDGAVSEGEFHETLNLASIWKLPIIFFLENNLYGMGSHVDKTHSMGRDLYVTADSYQIPAAQVDGMDILAVREATIAAVERVRSGGGPTLLEAMTYRFRGHSMADPSAYRDRAEVNLWGDRDPIHGFIKTMQQENLATPDVISSINTKVDEIMEDAVRFAEDSPEPDIDSVHDHVYA